MPETPETPLTVSVQEKPAGTVYVPVRTGTAYTGESWERGSDPKAVLSEDMQGFLEDCLMLPGGLDRLEELCKYWDTSSDEAVGRQIDETFEAMAVYDTAPGSVPEESAFEQAEDGTWEAQVEGSMGHAWCQVYEGADRGWVNKEHTPAAPGNGSAAEPIREPASGQETADSAEGNGLPAMYGGAVKLAGLARRTASRPENRRKSRVKKENVDVFGEEGLELLKKECPEVSSEEWDWFYEQAMRALYYHPDDGSKARERALRLYGKCADAVLEQMTAGRRLLCRYIYDISQGNGKSVEKEKK